ncbi:MAG: carbohydrate binding domain-containing protein [Bacteroidota bacterium]
MNSKLYTFIFCLFFGLISFNAQGQLVNGDMESWTDGLPDGWTTIESGITLTEENTIVNGGASSASVNVTTDTQGDTDFRQSISVVAGTSYDVSFWVYHTEGGVRARMYMETFQDYTLPELTNQWQQLSMTYEATFTGEIEVGIRFYDVFGNFDGEEIVYVDDYTVTPIVVTEPAIVITSPANGATLTSGSELVEFVVQNFDVSISGTGDGFVTGQVIASPTIPLTINNTDPVALPNLDNGEYEVVLELVDNDGNSLNPPAVDTVSFTVDIPVIIQVANIAELRAGVQGEAYQLTGEAVLTYQQSFRNQKYIQDASAGILIDDDPGTITSTYEVNDGITGITGTLGEFGGMLQFQPLSDPGAATSSGNTLAEQIITLADLTSDFEEYESELVTIIDITFDDISAFFENGTVYPISDPTGSYNFRTTFFNVDYIGGPVPSDMSLIVGIPNSRFDGEYFTARSAEDIQINVSSTEELSVTNFELSPNPSNGWFRLKNLGVAGNYELSVTDLLGRKVFGQQFYLNDQEDKIVEPNLAQGGLYLVQLRHLEQNYTRTVKVLFK